MREEDVEIGLSNLSEKRHVLIVDLRLLTMEVPGRYGVHGQSSGATFLLQIRLSPCVGRARACPPALRLMYPSRTRGALPVLTTENGAHGFD